MPQRAPAWWREPYLWLVLSGPLLVVAACIVTAWYVLRDPDQLIDADYYRKGIEINKTLADKAPPSLQPALQARNHAATQGLRPAEGD
jgi:hypothetical protein